MTAATKPRKKCASCSSPIKRGTTCKPCALRAYKPPTIHPIRHHAVERYRQRVNPNLTITQARDEIIRLQHKGTLSRKPPWWIAAGPVPSWGKGGFLVVDNRIVLVIGSYRGDRETLRVKTVIARDPFPMIVWWKLRRQVRIIKRRLSTLRDRRQ